jgi:hypothetical protein
MNNHRLPVIAWIDRCIVFVFLAALLGCAGEAAAPLAGATATGAPRGFSLPALPPDVPGRNASVTATDTKVGSQATLKSSGAVNSGPNLILPSQVGSMEWGIWQFVVDTGTPQEVALNFGTSFGQDTWIGIANYDLDRWELRGPYPASADPKTFSGLEDAAHTSPAGNIFVLVLTYGGSAATVNSISLTKDVPQTSFTVSGQVTDSATSQGLPGVTVTLDGGNPQFTDNSGNYSFADVPNGNHTLAFSLQDYTFAPDTLNIVVSGVDLPGQNSVGTEDLPDPVTYTNTMKAIMDTYCIGCHGADDPADGRRFDSYAFATLDDNEVDAVDHVWGIGDTFDPLDEQMPEEGSDEADTITLAERQLFDAWRDNNYAQ